MHKQSKIIIKVSTNEEVLI